MPEAQLGEFEGDNELLNIDFGIHEALIPGGIDRYRADPDLLKGKRIQQRLIQQFR